MMEIDMMEIDVQLTKDISGINIG